MFKSRRRQLAESLMPALGEMLGRRINPGREEFQAHLFTLLKIMREMPKLTLEEMARIIDESERPVQLVSIERSDALGRTGIGYATTGREALLNLTAGAILEETHNIVREEQQQEAVSAEF